MKYKVMAKNLFINELSESFQRMKTLYHESLSEVSSPTNGSSYNWCLGRPLGEGGFGHIVSCRLPHSSKMYAMKTEPLTKNTLCHEFNNYKKLCKIPCVANVVDFGIDTKENLRYLVIEKLCHFNYSAKYLYKIIAALEQFALCGYSHGDVKMENIMLRKTTDQLIFIDLGLAWKINARRDEKYASGTLVYMSVFAHNGIVHLKNDLESLAYSILDLKFDLPWHKEKEFEKVCAMKINFCKKFSTKCSFLKTEDPILFVLIVYIFSLEQKDTPDYGYLKKLALLNSKSLQRVKN